MQIINCGRGVHKREVRGVDRLRSLPNDWYAFTNLDLATGVGKSREIDVIIVADDRIFVVDLKDWDGQIQSENGRWLHNGRDTGASPVQKVHANTKDILYLLEGDLKRRAKGGRVVTPRIVGLVVITGNANLAKLAATETGSVFHVDRFIKAVASPQARVTTFKAVSPEFVSNPLTAGEWKRRLSSFFNARTGKLRPGRRRYGNFVAVSDDATFEHVLFAEYDAEDENASRTLGTLRVWDFSKAEGRFQTEEGRAEIAGREQAVVAFLKDRGDVYDNAILQPKGYDSELGVDYWEVFDRKRRLQRLSDFVASERAHVSRDSLYELARQMMAKVALLHAIDAAHLDLGEHSVWLEAPSTVKLSHLMAARYPQLTSLGENRFRFLSSIRLPEDVLGGGIEPKRKDVFLLGAAVHLLVFGHPLKPPSEADEVVEWMPSIDPSFEHVDLHPWFETALALEPTQRFADAAEAMGAFNAATASRPTAKDVLEGLESLRTAVRTQRQMLAAYPEKELLRESDKVDIWTSGDGTDAAFIKLWKRPAWGDQAREGPRILDFLQRAKELHFSPMEGCAHVRGVHWLGDAFAIVLDLVDGVDLATTLSKNPDRWRPADKSLTFLRRLAEVVLGLHERGLTHGDLKPGNIIVAGGDDPAPILVDLLDFSPSPDGDVITSAYAPLTGGRQERDRFAVGRIGEELLAACDLAAEGAAALANAIAFCRDTSPGNASLAPLLEALDRALSPPPPVETNRIVLSIKDAKVGNLLPDEGKIFVRLARSGWSFVLRGASEEIEVFLDARGYPTRARRLDIEQRIIGRIAKKEFMSIDAAVFVERADLTDLTGLQLLFDDPSFADQWGGPPTAPETETVEEDEPQIEEVSDEDTSDSAEDRLSERVASEPQVLARTDVPQLWRRLIDAEGELTTEGDALGASTYQRNISRHAVPFELARGTFDFNRADSVGVERLDRKGQWRRIGELDIDRSKPDRIIIEAAEYSNAKARDLIQEGERLRFTSHFGVQSLKRRESAISRILSRQSRVPELVDFFDPRIGSPPREVAHNIDPADLDAYDLNGDQARALATLASARPLGLVQGPPGTGKTKFIAALAHYALTKGLARNVLLASQSHEAVNNAAEAVLKLFSSGTVQPSILRVGNEGVVSERLLPYHTDKVETLFKDRYGAEARDRLSIAGRALGLPDDLTEAIEIVEMVILPIAARMAELKEKSAENTARVRSLMETLEAQLARISVGTDEIGDDATVLVDEIVARLLARPWAGSRVAPDRVARLRAVAQVGRDFLASVSTVQRGFETFLAGTRQIVAGTCVGLGRPSLGLTTTPFDLVIVDEAARCTASELSVPMQAGRWIVLVGDQAQLEPHHNPTVIEQVAVEAGVSRREILKSDFERAFETDYGRACGRTLLTQYRMLPPIGRLVSKTFYGNGLRHGRSEPEIDPGILPAGLEKVLAWVSTDALGEAGFERRQQDGTSLQNPSEADAILSLLRRWSEHEPFLEWVCNQTRHAHVVGIICMYAAQRDLIRRRVQTSNLPEGFRKSIKIDTVDSYQGKENPIVVLSLVRNNAAGSSERGAATIREGFLSRENRVNVAASRAMDRLLIVGALGRWKTSGAIGRLAKHFGEEVEAGEGHVISAVALFEGKGDRKERPRKAAALAEGVA